MKDDVTHFLSYPPIRWSLIALLFLIIALLIFHAGLAVGERRMYAGRGRVLEMHGTPVPFGFGGFGFSLPHGSIPDGHGVVGTITKVSLPTITVVTREGTSEDVLLTGNTVVRDASANPKLSDLTAGSQVVIIGEPTTATSSQALSALFIRVLGAATGTPAH